MAAINSGNETNGDLTEYTISPEETFWYHQYLVRNNNEKNWPTGLIQENKYGLRTHYFFTDLTNNQQTAQGIKNYGFSLRGIFNGSFLGWLRNSATLSDYDVYDNTGTGKYLGFIDAKVFTLAAARFDFKDSDGNTTAYATIQKTQVIIRDAKTDKVVGDLERIFVDGKKDSWKVKLTNDIDHRLALIFSATIVKNQAYFCKDR